MQLSGKNCAEILMQ